MAERAEEREELRKLSAVMELRAELMVTQAALASAMAEVARLSPDPKPLLGESVARLLGFADAAASGLRDQPRVNAQAPTTAALRMADWAEGLLCGSPGGGPGSSQGGKQRPGQAGG
jgi:hypothetical protein